MKKLISQHPYAVTSAIFLVLIVFGFLHLNWRKDDYMFMLLLYFIVTLSVRLDDIVRRIGPHRETDGTEENVVSALREITTALKETNYRLKAIQNRIDQDPDN